jgi:coenzyme PQQ precursor peptide PqqA
VERKREFARWREALSVEVAMKLEWRKPVVVEQQVGLEVTSYQSAELDRT